MAQFTSRPETPQEWGGLPAEPLRREHTTDLAPPTSTTDLFGDALGSIGVEIVVPATPGGDAPDSANAG